MDTLCALGTLHAKRIIPAHKQLLKQIPGIAEDVFIPSVKLDSLGDVTMPSVKIKSNLPTRLKKIQTEFLQQVNSRKKLWSKLFTKYDTDTGAASAVATGIKNHINDCPLMARRGTQAVGNGINGATNYVTNPVKSFVRNAVTEYRTGNLKENMAYASGAGALALLASIFGIQLGKTAEREARHAGLNIVSHSHF